MEYYRFTLRKIGNSKVRVSVPIDGVSTYLFLTFKYNQIGEYWTLSVADSAQNELLSNKPLVTGHNDAQNLLRQVGYLGIGSAFVVNLVDYPSTDVPNYDNWLTEFDLYWGSEAA